jgi:hypothetical protein
MYNDPGTATATACLSSVGLVPRLGRFGAGASVSDVLAGTGLKITNSEILSVQIYVLSCVSLF